MDRPCRFVRPAQKSGDQDGMAARPVCCSRSAGDGQWRSTMVDAGQRWSMPVKGVEAMELEGQTTIVTGAGRGIGRSIALELATLGSDIVVADVLDKNAEQVAEEIHALGRQAIPIRVDVTSRSDLDAMAAKAMSELGRIDVLVNNAGVNWFGSVLEVTEESWDFVMDVNAKAVFFASQAVLPHMFAAKKGSIVSLASMAGKLAAPTAWRTRPRRRRSSASPGAWR